MAAIAYVSDEKMLEYHRFNGSHSIVFWRLSTKKFTDFKPGDLLFFLAKDENNPRKEKGLKGYGCFVSESSLSINSLWKHYGKATGYNTKEELYEAILRSCKSEELPKKISCLILEKVVFFQTPVYLSSLGYQISNKLESFTYLDHNEGEQTLKILNAAKEIGLDSWSAMENETINDELFEQQLVKYQIATILESMDCGWEMPNKKSLKVFEQFADQQPVWINQKHTAFMVRQEDNVLYYLYDSPVKSEKENYYRLLGEMAVLKNELAKNLDEGIRIVVLSPVEFNEKQLVNLNNIQVEYQKV